MGLDDLGYVENDLHRSEGDDFEFEALSTCVCQELSGSICIVPVTAVLAGVESPIGQPGAERTAGKRIAEVCRLDDLISVDGEVDRLSNDRVVEWWSGGVDAKEAVGEILGTDQSHTTLPTKDLSRGEVDGRDEMKRSRSEAGSPGRRVGHHIELEGRHAGLSLTVVVRVCLEENKGVGDKLLEHKGACADGYLLQIPVGLDHLLRNDLQVRYVGQEGGESLRERELDRAIVDGDYRRHTSEATRLG